MAAFLTGRAEMTKDEGLRIEALRHLESAGGNCCLDEMEDRIAAAHYLVQAMLGGPVNQDFDEVVATARFWDAVGENDELM
jgi:hypothetical protein